MAEASELLPSGSGPSNDPRSAACRHRCAPGGSPLSASIHAAVIASGG